MKKLYIIGFENHVSIDRDDLLVMDDSQDLIPQVTRYFEGKGWCDYEPGNPWSANTRFYEAAALDADGNEYNIILTFRRGLNQELVAA